ncbi:MAG: ABC transporter ATP-binding protein/permease [Acidisphaera sp.]|nr:ABC transporter ATP-binding protein/permease [Acidisphaera sp.]
MRGFGSILRDAWRLTWPYFRSSERWSAFGLLGSIIALNLSLNGFNLVLNFWNRDFYNALQEKDWRAFLELLFTWRRVSGGGFMPGFVSIVVVYILIAVYSRYLRQWLQIRWRRWLTSHFLTEWLADRAYYRISLTGGVSGADSHGVGTDNPDQRISDDISSFAADTLVLSLDLLSNVVTLFSFLGILWTLSGPITLLGITIPGYMLWAALGYSLVGTVLTHLIGRPLIRLNFLQQRYEANFRFALVRLRENVEGIALYGGEDEERAGAVGRFGDVVQNWWQIMRRTKLLNSLVFGYTQVANIFPLAVASPRFFAGNLTLGGLTQLADAFGQVQGAMSWFVGAYASLATWSATVERLATFDRTVAAARAASGEGVHLTPGKADAIALRDVTLAIPGGRELMSHQDLSFPAGQSVAITGRSGSGKSTLFRAIAGIWPFGSGVVERPGGTVLFLPQRPYIPLGSLRRAVCYPAAPMADDQAVCAALEAVGLGRLAERLDEEDNWTLRLSGGEQQRLAIARALVLRPDWLFLDEATANLDPEAEAELYRLLKAWLPATTLVSIAHRPSVGQLHDRRLTFAREPDTPGMLVAAE